jgi:hypothetical protein
MPFRIPRLLDRQQKQKEGFLGTVRMMKKSKHEGLPASQQKSTT